MLRAVVCEATSPSVEAIWRALESRARPAYFLTWPWVENWLASLPRAAMPEAVVLYDIDAPVGAFFAGRHAVQRHGVFRGRGRFLNATGHPRFDELGDAARFSVDEKLRAQAYKEMTQIFHEQVPWIGVIQPIELYGLQKYMDWKAHPIQQIELRRFNFRFHRP